MSTTATPEATERWDAYRHAAEAAGHTAGGLDPQLYERYLYPSTRISLDAIHAEQSSN